MSDLLCCNHNTANYFSSGVLPVIYGTLYLDYTITQMVIFIKLVSLTSKIIQ